MIEFRPFKAEDVLELTNTIDSIPDKDTLLKQAEINQRFGMGYTYYLNGKIIGVAGIRFVRNGVGHIWSLFSAEIGKHKKTFFRCSKIMLDIVCKNNGIKKLRTESRIGFPQSQRLLEHLGFTKQRRNLINRDYFLYLRIM